MLTSTTVAETWSLGARLARWLRGGDVVVLQGELGAGKTHFVQGIVEALGVPREEANSPTFVLIQEYQGVLPICHIDAYRLRDSDEFVELGADELLGSDVLCLIEWGNRVAEVLPHDRLTVDIQITDESIRQFLFIPSGPRSQEIVDRMSEPFRAS